MTRRLLAPRSSLPPCPSSLIPLSHPPLPLALSLSSALPQSLPLPAPHPEASFLFDDDEKTILQHRIAAPRMPLESVLRVSQEEVCALSDLSSFVGADLVQWRTEAMKVGGCG